MKYTIYFFLFITSVALCLGQNDKEQIIWERSTKAAPIIFSKDAQWLLVRPVGKPGNPQSFDSTEVRILLTQTGDSLYSFKDTLGIKEAIFSPNNQLLATSTSNGLVRIWDIQSQKIIYTLKDSASTPKIRSLEFSPDSRNILISGSSNIYVWEVSSAKMIWKSTIDYVKTQLPSYRTDSSYILVRTISHSTPGFSIYKEFLLNAATGEIIRQETVNAMRIHSSNGKYYKYEEENTVYDAYTNKPVTSFALEGIKGVQIFSSQWEYMVHTYPILTGYMANIWNVSTGKKIRTYAVGSTLPVVSPNTHYMATYFNSSIRMHKIFWATSVKEETNFSNVAFSVLPNPISTEAFISFSLLKDSKVTISLIDMMGNVVKNIVSDVMPAGENKIQWNRYLVPEGMYFMQYTSGTTITQLPCIITR